MTTNQLALGMRGEAIEQVTGAKTAQAVGSGNLPVYATPMMVALMEQAAVATLEGHLPSDADTVGTKVEIMHLAATPVGMKIRATAKIIHIEDRKITFEVEAFDEKDKIGSGIHQRFIINQERFMAKCVEKGEGK